MNNWNISISNPFIKPITKEFEGAKSTKGSSIDKTGLFGSQKLSGIDEFIPQAKLQTNPVKEIQNQQNLIKIQQAANLQPVVPKSILQSNCPVDNLAMSFVNLIDLKDSYTGAHSKAVKSYSEALAKNLDLSAFDVETIGLGSVFHDIGKIGTPESILNKQDKLTNEEFEEIKKHPSAGSKIIEGIPTFRDTVSQIVRSHHENWDGSGYPDKIKGERIPLGARIVAIADSFHAMTSNRPYRQGLPTSEAVKRLQNGAGQQWDPDLVNEFIKTISLK